MSLPDAEKQKRIAEVSIDISVSILGALKKMDSFDSKLLIVTESDSFRSLVSIGDIQRAIINGVALTSTISSILRKKINVCNKNDSYERVKEKMMEFRTEFMPLVDENNEIVDIIFWEELFDHHHSSTESSLNIPVVIMAGGQGTRLKPLTNTIPKPLVPLGDKSIIEIIIDRFCEIGSKNFFVSVNYKAEMIKQYFDDIPDKNFSINYFAEPKPLGTAGSLYLLKDQINTSFFVSNCDIIIDQDYKAIYNYHKESGNELTIVAAIKHFQIPYGTLQTGTNGLLSSIEEKPELTFMVNTGMYVLEPHLLAEIPEDKFFHITELIEQKLAENSKVGVFPVSEGAWMDVGDWAEYNKTQEIFKLKYSKWSRRI